MQWFEKVDLKALAEDVIKNRLSGSVELVEKHWYEFELNGLVHTGYCLGADIPSNIRCIVCKDDIGQKVEVAFNLWIDPITYRTVGFCRDHMPFILKDLGTYKGLLYDRGYNPITGHYDVDTAPVSELLERLRYLIEKSVISGGDFYTETEIEVIKRTLIERQGE